MKFEEDTSLSIIESLHSRITEILNYKKSRKIDL